MWKKIKNARFNLSFELVFLQDVCPLERKGA
jgi:hypothetical protein